jgi:hypothetical protein
MLIHRTAATENLEDDQQTAQLAALWAEWTGVSRAARPARTSVGGHLDCKTRFRQAELPCARTARSQSRWLHCWPSCAALRTTSAERVSDLRRHESPSCTPFEDSFQTTIVEKDLRPKVKIQLEMNRRCLHERRTRPAKIWQQLT